MKEDRTVVSEYEDFYKYFILKGELPKLLMITVGNIVNWDLITLFEKNIEQREANVKNNRVVELSDHVVTVHF